MSPQHQKMHWQHTEDDLHLLVLGQATAVPDAIAEHLIGTDGVGVSTKPAEDLLRLECLLRQRALHQDKRVAEAEAAVSAARVERDQLTGRRGFRARRLQRHAAEHLHAAAAEHAAEIQILDEMWDTVDELRGFVIGLNLFDGLLSEAAAGWQRSARTPGWVTAFRDESTFLTTDPRRATTSCWGGSTIAGEEYGLAWRRDGDDDAGDQATVASGGGPWCLGFIPRTGEIYALRRDDLQPEELWLLGTGFVDDERTRQMLRELEDHMLEPNSLILAARTIRDAQEGLHVDHRPLMTEHGESSESFLADATTQRSRDVIDSGGSTGC